MFEPVLSIPPRETPLVGVMADKFVAGAYRLEGIGNTVAQTIVPLRQACETEWSSDAHFTTYQPVGPSQHINPEDAWCRINKLGPLLQELRGMGCDVVTNMLVFDLDTRPNKPWSDLNHLAHFEQCILGLEVALPWASGWAYAYTSMKGARLVYILPEPVPVDRAENYHRWVVKELQEVGFDGLGGNLYADHQCSDWTRVFRLPRVVRDGSRTSQFPFFRDWARWNRRLPVSSLGQIEGEPVASFGSTSQPIDTSKPKREDAIRLIETISGNNRIVMTDFFKYARDHLRGRECFEVVFQGTPLAVPGSRNSTLLRFVGQITGILLPRWKGYAPHHTYALLLQAAEQLEPDAGTHDWTDALWGMCQRIFNSEFSKEEARQQQQQHKAQENIGLAGEVIQGMATWCDEPLLHDPELFSDEAKRNAAIAWMQRRALVMCKSDYFVLQRDGYYRPFPLTEKELIPHIRTRDLDWLIPTRCETAEGFVDRKPDNIRNEQAIDVVEIELRPSGKISAWVENMTSSVLLPKIVMSPFARNPLLAPEFNPDVDEWLKRLFGQQYELMNDQWIPHALAFEDGAVAAVSILAEEGNGKNLFVQGMLECLVNPFAATAEDILGDYHYGLLKSPFVVVDEGWPVGSSSQAHLAADVFRRLVTGSAKMANVKYLAPVNVHLMPRVILTANNSSMTDIFTMGRSMTMQDQQAIAIRLIHIHASNSAREWLASKGGLQFTGKEGSRWIASGPKGKSNHVLAKHFLYLHANRAAPKGRRMLVDGGVTPQMADMFRASSGPAQTMMQVIAMAISKAPALADNRFKLPDGFVWDGEESRLLVTIVGVERLCKKENETAAGRTDLRLRIRDIREHISSISHPQFPRAIEHEGIPMFVLDLDLLVRFARNVGLSTERLEFLASPGGRIGNGRIYSGNLQDGVTLNGKHG